MDEQSIACTNGWRSIDTAPKNGTEILTFNKDGVHIGWWYIDEWCYQNLHLSMEPPTHWQPLPKPPQEIIK